MHEVVSKSLPPPREDLSAPRLIITLARTHFSNGKSAVFPLFMSMRELEIYSAVGRERRLQVSHPPQRFYFVTWT